MKRLHQRNRHAFTLIELIVVISVISVLMGLLYGALERAKKFSRRAIAFSELKAIENAFIQFRAHYHTWPIGDTVEATSTESTESAADTTTTIAEKPIDSVDNKDHGFVIDRRIANLLQGLALDVSKTDKRNFNYEGLPFIEFSRYSVYAPYPPINPFKSNTAGDDTARCYYVLFDTNGDHQIHIPALEPGDIATNIIADVAVWTYIPGTRSGRGSNTGETTQTASVNDERLESWSGFNVK